MNRFSGLRMTTLGATFTGLICFLGLMNFSMCIARGLWALRFSTWPPLNSIFIGHWHSVSIVLCLYASSFLGTLLSVASTKEEGALSGFFIWCSCTVIWSIWLFLQFHSVSLLAFGNPRVVMLRSLIEAVFGFAVAILAGIQASRQIVAKLEVTKQRAAA